MCLLLWGIILIICLVSHWWMVAPQWPAPPSPCLCQCDVGLTRGVGSGVGTLRQMKGHTCVQRSFSSGSPSPPRARPSAAFHSNLMIMIFAQDDLCLHSVITPPAFYDLGYWKSMGHKSAPSELIIITARFFVTPRSDLICCWVSYRMFFLDFHFDFCQCDSPCLAILRILANKCDASYYTLSMFVLSCKDKMTDH